MSVHNWQEWNVTGWNSLVKLARHEAEISAPWRETRNNPVTRDIKMNETKINIANRISINKQKWPPSSRTESHYITVLYRTAKSARKMSEHVAKRWGGWRYDERIKTKDEKHTLWDTVGMNFKNKPTKKPPQFFLSCSWDCGAMHSHLITPQHPQSLWHIAAVRMCAEAMTACAMGNFQCDLAYCKMNYCNSPTFVKRFGNLSWSPDWSS